jgi:outer membrane protein OmpA-like peptidoglycan-associated protein
MTGTVFDALTRKRIRADLELVNLENGRTEFSMESEKDFGTYTVVLKAGVSYGLFASRSGYLFGSVSVRTDTLPPGGIRRDIYLEPIRAGATITLNNLFFESGKADILPASLNELRKIGRLMALNPALNIEIAGHTDDIGQDADNLLLSQRRARAVADHLMRQGIKKERLKAVGYGETRPSVPNTGESARALNRRIEFRVLP